MATLKFNRGRAKLVKTDIKPNYFIKFILFGKIDKLDFDTKNKE